MIFQTTLPKNNQKTRDELYQGTVFQCPATTASKKLVHMVYEVLYQVLGTEPRKAERKKTAEQFFNEMGIIRKKIYTQPRFHQAIRSCIAALGFDNTYTAFDPARLRIINHDGHHNPLAAAVYYPHRDIWYGHPKSLITWWIPLDSLMPEETFCFYPDFFHTPVHNSSEIFDYDQWVAKGWDLKIGWQKVSQKHRNQYPAMLQDIISERTIGFSCQKAENLLFAGAHLHRTLPQSLGRTRFSLDFRIVDMRDFQANKGAPRIDDNSKGNAVRDYIQPGRTTWNSPLL
ncbi:MAG: hypothetical protein CL916_14235 [Deltaproteobacteria bacterium]|nr:hypothetical protein [Deltaproteobacteria bacterium]